MLLSRSGYGVLKLEQAIRKSAGEFHFQRAVVGMKFGKVLPMPHKLAWQ